MGIMVRFYKKYGTKLNGISEVGSIQQFNKFAWMENDFKEHVAGEKEIFGLYRKLYVYL